jgi:hypothetical protein
MIIIMRYIIYLYIIIIVLILLKQVNLLERFFGIERFESINSNSLVNNSVSNINSPNFPKYLELKNLSRCSSPLRFFYGLNKNYLWNDGRKINMEVLRQESRNFVVYRDEKYKLRDLFYKSSNLLLNGKPVHFQLNLYHSNINGDCDMEIIIPLIMSKNNIVRDVELLEKRRIPEYRGESKKFGSVNMIDLSVIGNLLKKSEYYKYNLSDKYHWLITDPVNISLDYGVSLDRALRDKYSERILNESSLFDNGDYEFY